MREATHVASLILLLVSNTSQSPQYGNISPEELQSPQQQQLYQWQLQQQQLVEAQQQLQQQQQQQQIQNQLDTQQQEQLLLQQQEQQQQQYQQPTQVRIPAVVYDEINIEQIDIVQQWPNTVAGNSGKPKIGERSQQQQCGISNGKHHPTTVVREDDDAVIVESRSINNIRSGNTSNNSSSNNSSSKNNNGSNIINSNNVSGNNSNSNSNNINNSSNHSNNNSSKWRITQAGWPAEPNEWPWIAAILQNGRIFCGGSLIDDRHIMTAAHCATHITPEVLKKVTVRLGAYDLTNKEESSAFETAAIRVKYNKEFTQENLRHDVAVITLAEAVPLSDKIMPVCLPEAATDDYSAENYYEGKVATVVGWGASKLGEGTSATLNELTMEIWSHANCSNAWNSFSSTFSNSITITEQMLCAGHIGTDACQGDSGGPLLIKDEEGEKWTQVGIVSFGDGCGKEEVPGVYTRVSAVREWVDRAREDV